MDFRKACSTRLCSQVSNVLFITTDVLLREVDSFDYVQEKYPKLVAIDSTGRMTGNVVDFCKNQPQSRLAYTPLTTSSLLGTV